MGLISRQTRSVAEIAQWHRAMGTSCQTVSESDEVARFQTETPSPYYFSRLKRAHSQLADIYADMKCQSIQTESIG